MLIVVLLSTSTGNCFAMLVEQKDTISNLSFSHDGKKVVFDRCREGDCQIQVYNLETGELAAYQSPKNERWTMGRYSYDGKRIAFSVIPIKPNDDLELGGMQIAVMDADGKNYRKVTSGPGAKLYPTFSHNGKKILYARAARIRKSGRTPAADYDAWEVDLTTGRQMQLTFCEYFYMGNLNYFPDDERFIYYGDRPSVFEGVRSYQNESAFGNKMIELERQGKGIQGTVVMKSKELIKNPYVFPEKTYPQKPLLSKDGSMLIYEKSDSGKFYLYSADGNHRLAVDGGPSVSAAISADWELFASIGAGSTTLHIHTLQNGKLRTILYVSYAKKQTVNWEEAYKRNESWYKMLPEKPSSILNK
jgi:WD40 repeat protein